jgi:hypothetical protein
MAGGLPAWTTCLEPPFNFYSLPRVPVVLLDARRSGSLVGPSLFLVGVEAQRRPEPRRRAWVHWGPTRGKDRIIWGFTCKTVVFTNSAHNS